MAINQEDLMDDIEKYLFTYAESYCKAAEKEMTIIAKNAIYQFYEDYAPNNGKPKFYVRTFDLRDHSYSPYHHNNGSTYYGGVRISSEDMQPYNEGTKWETDPFIVADLGWHGWHGDPIRGIYTTPPLDIIKEEIKGEKFLRKIENEAEKAVKSKKYKVIQKLLE